MKLRSVVQLMPLTILCFACKEDKNPALSSSSQNHSSVANPSTTPKTEAELTAADDTILTEVKGDLDQDGQAEKVQAVLTAKSRGEGREQVLRIYRKSADTWQLWYSDSLILHASDEMDWTAKAPWGSGEIRIEKGCLVLKENAGKDGFSLYRYRFQKGDWFMIGATRHSYLDNSAEEFESWRDYDLNLSTGLVSVQIKSESSAEEDSPAMPANTSYVFKAKGLGPIAMRSYDHKLRIQGKDGKILVFSIFDSEQ